MTNGTIKEGEHHPAADNALAYIQKMNDWELAKHREALASTALSGNRLAEICSETLERLQKGDPVSDRYLLGLAWTLRNIEEKYE